MKYEIKNRFSGAIQFTAEIEATEDNSTSVKLGLAIKAAYEKGGAYLKGADLEGADLEGADLEGADLKGADLEGADLKGAYLKGAYLEGAYLKGAYLKGADLEGADLEGADLKGAYLEGAYLEGAYLKGAYLKGAYLKGAYLKGADLKGAYLKGAYLEGADLEGADLEGVKHWDETPIIPNIHQAVYSAASQPKALNMSSWHTCETTHCRAGWVVTLAGEAGKKLEDKLTTPVAAALIYAKSDPNLGRMPDFYASNPIAMGDMRRRAKDELEKTAA